MPNLGPAEILMILVVALVLFGPRRLPELGKSAGQMLRSFRQATSSVTDELKAGLDTPAPVLVPASAPVHAAASAAAVAPPIPVMVVAAQSPTGGPPASSGGAQP